MYLTIKKTSRLQGRATVPGSKSLSIRGLLFALLANGESTLFNCLNSDDVEAAMAVCKALGASISIHHDAITLRSDGLPFNEMSDSICTGNSGITTSFVLPLLGLRKNYNDPIIVNCNEQMRNRPMQPLVNALCQLGMNIQYIEHEGEFPVSVAGQLKGGVVEINGESSQYLSALLIGLPCASDDSVITVKNLNERPYINMTLACLLQHGIKVVHHQVDNIDTFYINGQQRYSPFETAINGDYSSASCLIAAAVLLPGDVELEGLDSDDSQGDKVFIQLLQKMGAEIEIKQNSIRIKGNKSLKGIRVDANDIPDLLPALAVIATYAEGKTEIYNDKQARFKETDRIHSMTEGLRKMGAHIEENEDGMIVHQSILQGTLVNGYEDHRTVMALTVAGMIANGTTVVTDGEAVNKTYPGFCETISSLGADIITNSHIVLMGFKHVGKTTIGRRLAKSLNKQFIDLDREVERFYASDYGIEYSCREIMKTLGETAYRKLESNVLKEQLKSSSCVISLGGGTLSNQDNQELIKRCLLLHVIASRGIVFERIMVEGRPAFFDPDEDPYVSFSRLWEERNSIYKNMADYTVDNSGSIDQAVKQAMTLLQQQGYSNYA